MDMTMTKIKAKSRTAPDSPCSERRDLIAWRLIRTAAR